MTRRLPHIQTPTTEDERSLRQKIGQNRWVQRIAFLLLVFIFSILILFAMRLTLAPANDRILDLFGEPFLALPLPPDTEEVRTVEIWGNLDEEDMGCDFRVQRVLLTTLSEEEIRAYYVTVGFPPIYEDSPNAVVFGVDNLIRPIVSYTESIISARRNEVTVTLFDSSPPGATSDWVCW